MPIKNFVIALFIVSLNSLAAPQATPHETQRSPAALSEVVSLMHYKTSLRLAIKQIQSLSDFIRTTGETQMRQFCYLHGQIAGTLSLHNADLDANGKAFHEIYNDAIGDPNDELCTPSTPYSLWTECFSSKRVAKIINKLNDEIAILTNKIDKLTL